MILMLAIRSSCPKGVSYIMSINIVLKMLCVGWLLVFCFSHTTFAKQHTLLVVLTHGDDAVSIAPLIARYATEGHTVHFAIFTGVQDPSDVEGSPVREGLLCASRALSIKENFVMRGPAGEGSSTTMAIADRLVEIIDQTRPDVIITWGPDGLTGHPRHILVGSVVTRVFQQQGHLKHRPRKLYYIAYPESRFPASKRPFGGIADVNGPFGTVTDSFITTKVDGSRYLKQTADSIACFTITQEDNAKWQQSWKERVTTTLGGTTFLRLVLPVAMGRETDIFKGL